jgi:hypothetical protein
MIDEVTYRLVVHTLIIHILVKHLSFHQFGVVTHDESEIVIHGVRMMLDLHLDWVVL